MKDVEQIAAHLAYHYKKWIESEERYEEAIDNNASRERKDKLNSRSDHFFTRITDMVKTAAFVMEIDEDEIWNALDKIS